MPDEWPDLFLQYHAKPMNDPECKQKRLSVWPPKGKQLWTNQEVLEVLSALAVRCLRAQPKRRDTVAAVLPELEQLLVGSSPAGVFG
jgi:hypothetical protein